MAVFDQAWLLNLRKIDFPTIRPLELMLLFFCIEPFRSSAMQVLFPPKSLWQKFKLENALSDNMCTLFDKTRPLYETRWGLGLAAGTKSVEPIGSYLNSGVFFVVFLPFPFQELLKHYSFGFIPEMGDLGRRSLTRSLLFPIQFFTVSLSRQ